MIGQLKLLQDIRRIMTPKQHLLQKSTEKIHINFLVILKIEGPEFIITNFRANVEIHRSRQSTTVDRHRFNHLATKLTTFAAFPWPLFCMYNIAKQNRIIVQGEIELPALKFFKYLLWFRKLSYSC